MNNIASTNSKNSPEEIAQQLVDNFNNRTYQQEAGTYYTDDTVFVDLPTERESVGIDAVIQSSDVWVQSFPDVHGEVVSHEVNGDTVTTSLRGTGTFTGQMDAPDGSIISGNGSSLDISYIQTIHVEGGMVVRQEADYDLPDMMSQLGLN
jgi:hypothetical protein